MPRSKRVHYKGAFYHVMFRGNNGRDIFFSNDERWHFCGLLEEIVKKFSCKIHSFCLMSNHVHLLIEVDDIPLSKSLHFVAFHYARWLNNRQKLTGHLFQDRYKAKLVTKQSYLLQLCRYIHLNPVKAGMVDQPGDYFWSSHSDYLGKKKFSWITRNFIFNELDATADHSILRYSVFMLSEYDHPKKLSFRH